MAFSSIDLSKIPSPDVIETISYEGILAALKNQAITELPDLEPVLAVESEPATKILEVCALFIMLDRQRVNEAARSVMLAFATGSDLEHLGALFGVERRVITAATATDPAVMESDAELRARIQLAPEAYTSAGSMGSYVFHALSADSDVADVQVDSPTPGNVRVVVQTKSGTGVPATPLLTTVDAALSADDVRPLTDNVSVIAATAIDFTVNAVLKVPDGPDRTLVEAAASDALDAYLAKVKKLGGIASVSGIMAALSQDEVVSVDLVSPTADVGGVFGSFPSCSNITITSEAP